jgi:hypothetical protein
MSKTDRPHEHGRGDRLAWAEGPGREAGEGVVVELVPATAADRQPRYRLRVFRDGAQTEDEMVLPQGILTRVPRWEPSMSRDERRRFHGGRAAGWNEEIPDQ